MKRHGGNLVKVESSLVRKGTILIGATNHSGVCTCLKQGGIYEKSLYLFPNFAMNRKLFSVLKFVEKDPALTKQALLCH